VLVAEAVRVLAVRSRHEAVVARADGLLIDGQAALGSLDLWTRKNGQSIARSGSWGDSAILVPVGSD